MNSKTRRKLANSYEIYDGAATVWFTPVVTLRYKLVVSDARKLFKVDDDGPEWFNCLDDAQIAFYLIEGYIVDFEINDLSEEHQYAFEMKSIQTYMENRNGNLSNNWDAFADCLTNSMIQMLFDGYRDTRRVIPEIENEILKEPPPDLQTDPKGTGSGRKRTKKKSAAT